MLIIARAYLKFYENIYYSDKVIDAGMASYVERNLEMIDSSRYAGGVFIDKSVYTATEAMTDAYFEDIRSSLSFGSDNFGNENCC